MLLKYIAKAINAEVIGNSDLEINQISTLNKATANDISFLSNAKYENQLKTTKAKAVILAKTSQNQFSGTQVLVEDAYLSFAIVSALLNPALSPKPKTHQTAVIDKLAKVAKSCQIDANVVIEANVIIGESCHIGAGTVITCGCKIGNNCKIVANATLLSACQIGSNCIIHAGTVIGGDGFGFANNKGKFVKIPQIGSVIIGDDVEIGSCTSVDCGAIDNTIIGNGVKLDNQIQVGHNVKIGDDTAIAATVAIAGSVEIGKRCQIGGFTAIVGHLKIADDTIITASSFVTKSTQSGKIYSSAFVAKEVKVWQRMVTQLSRLSKTKNC